MTNQRKWMLLPLAVLVVSMLSVSVQAEEEKEKLIKMKDLDKIRKTLKMDPTETVVFVDDMHCKNCAKKVARKLFTVKGVVKVRTDLKLDVAIVTPQKDKKLKVKELWSAAEAAEIPPVKIVGPEGAYIPESKEDSGEPKAA